MLYLCFFFFFKQKTAYEMRISDWSSDVCSSDLDGSCQALLNMSLGFNGEATVRENVFLRGTAMRLKAVDMRDKIESSMEFAGLQEKSSHRLRTLSSAQKMRLGFEISTTVHHVISLMGDRVGWGDLAFVC